MIERLKEVLLKVDKNTFLILGLLGILLCIIMLPTSSVDSNELPNEPISEKEEVVSSNQQEEMDYVASLEKRLEVILEDMEGSGAVTVMITLESTYEQILQKDTDTQTTHMSELDGAGGSRETNEGSAKQVTIFEETQGGEKSPYVVKMNTPKIEGVFVVAQGGGNESVCKNISDVIQALFGIDAHKIKVVKMK